MPQLQSPCLTLNPSPFSAPSGAAAASKDLPLVHQAPGAVLQIQRASAARDHRYRPRLSPEPLRQGGAETSVSRASLSQQVCPLIYTGIYREIRECSLGFQKMLTSLTAALQPPRGSSFTYRSRLLSPVHFPWVWIILKIDFQNNFKK